MKRIALWLAVLLMAGALWAEPVRIGPAVDATGAPVESKDVEVWVAMPGQDFRLEKNAAIRYDRLGWYWIDLKMAPPKNDQAVIVLRVPGSVIDPWERYGNEDVNVATISGDRPGQASDIAREVRALREPGGILPYIVSQWFLQIAAAMALIALAARIGLSIRRELEDRRWLRHQRDLDLIRMGEADGAD